MNTQVLSQVVDFAPQAREARRYLADGRGQVLRRLALRRDFNGADVLGRGPFVPGKQRERGDEPDQWP